MRLIAIAVISLSILQPALAQDGVPDGLLYCAHFDEHSAGSWAQGSRAPVAFNPRLPVVEGKFGNAVLLSGQASLGIVADDGNFRHDQGTVEMWVRPDWPGDDGQVHVLFNCHVERGNYLNINKLDNGMLGAATGGAGEGRYTRIERDISDWQAGQWRHLAATWGDGKLAFYIDGELVGEAEEGSIAPRRNPPTITIGGSWDGAIDELAIWSVRKDTFDLTAPIAAPELEAPEMGTTLPPPVTDLDRYQFDLPATDRGYHLVPKHFVDELDPTRQPGELPEAPELATFAAGGEYQTLGLTVYATGDLADLAFTPSDLTGPDGALISADEVQVRLNRRAMQLPRPRVGDEERRPAATLLDPARPFDLPAGHFKETAVTVHVPEGAAPGVYEGTIAVTCEGDEATEVPLRVEVLSFDLQPSERKAFGMYYQMDLSPVARDRVRAELQDLRDHHVTRLFSYLKLQHEMVDGELVTSYEEVAEGLALLAEFGFHGEIIVQDGFGQLARALGHENVEQGSHGESLLDDAQYEAAVKAAIEGLDPLREQYPQFEIVLTHMDEVMGKHRRYLYMNLARPIRQVPDQRIYITMHTLPRDYVPEATAELDPWMDIRCYNGHALDLYIQAGGSWEALAEEIAASGDEGWFYYNPHRVWFVAEWSRIINSTYFWTSPLTVHCPYRYRTMRTYPLSFIHNMACTVMSPEDFVTPIATRNWEGFRLGAQDCWYTVMLEDLVAQAGEEDVACAEAEAWLAELRDLMPTTDEVQDVSSEDFSNYPVVSNLADALTGADYERMRRTTAEHIIVLQDRLK